MKKVAKTKVFLMTMAAAMAIASILPSCRGLSEKCLKDYYLTGTVTDNNDNPLSDVQVVMRGAAGDEALLTSSIGDGTYLWSSLQTRSWYSQRFLKFVKPGYTTYEAVPFTESEAGPDVCGAITLRRDAVLLPAP